MNGYYPMYNMMQPEDRVIGLASIEEVKAYPMPPSSRFPFFSTVEDVCWIKSTDSNGAYTIITFDMERREEPSEYVTREEYDKLLKMLEEMQDGKHVIPGK